MPGQSRRFCLVQLSLLLVALSLTGCDGGLDITAEEHIARAKAYHTDGDLSSGAIELRNALQKEPDNREARWLLGQFYLEVGEGAAADKEIRRAVELGWDQGSATVALTKAKLLQGKLKEIVDEVISETIDGRDKGGSLTDETHSQLLALRGHAFLAFGNVSIAKELYDAALDVEPNNLEAQVGLAKLDAAHGKTDAARSRLEVITESYADFAPAWSLLADIYRHQGAAEEAEEAYGKAIAQRWNNDIDRLKRALVRIHLKEYEKAEKDIVILTKRIPTHPSVLYARGLLSLHRGEHQAARSAFQDTLNIEPSYTPAWYYLGLSHFIEGNFEQAENDLVRFLNSHPDSDDAARLIGMIRLSGEDYEGAEAVLTPVLRRNPSDLMTMNLLGHVALPQGKSEEGIAYLRKAVSEHRQSATAHFNLALGLLREGHQEEGVQELETASELDPQLQDADVYLIWNLLLRNEFDKAIAAAERLREKQPNSPLPLDFIGLAHIGKGDEATARAHFRHALELEPGDVIASNNLALLALGRGNIAEARKIYHAALERNPGHLGLLLQFAALERKARRFEDAKELLEQAMEANPKAVQPRLLLGRYYLSTGQPVQALVLLREIGAVNANHPAYLEVKGESELASERYEEAEKTLKHLVDLQPHSAQAHYLLARAYLERGSLDEARQAVETAASLAPEHLNAQITLSRLLMYEGNVAKANGILERLKERYPGHVEVIGLEGWLALQQNRPKDAISAFQNLPDKARNSRIILDLANAQWQANKWETSLSTQEAWLRSNPDDVLVRFDMATKLQILHREASAKELLGQIIKQSPEHVQALNNQAWLLRKESPNDALRYAERAHRLAPTDPFVMDTLGVLLLERGQTARATALLQEASKKDPDNLQIRYHLARALVDSGDKNQARGLLERIVSDGRFFLELSEAKALLEELGS